MEPIFVQKKSPISSIMKSDQTIIRKNHMEQLHFITTLLDIKDPNIQFVDVFNRDTHKEIIAKLDYDAPSFPECGSQMKKYDFQKPSRIPYLETTGMPTRILLRKRRFKCYQCSKMVVAETSLVKKNHQIPRITNQKIAQKLIEKTSMTDIAHQLFILTPNWKPRIISSNSSSAMPLDFRTLKTSKNGFSQL